MQMNNPLHKMTQATFSILFAIQFAGGLIGIERGHAFNGFGARNQFDAVMPIS